MERKYLPWSVEVKSNPWANVGEVKARGLMETGVQTKAGNVDLTTRGNIMTYSKNGIIERDGEFCLLVQTG